MIISDEKISDVIDDHLYYDKLVDSNDIDLVVDSGIVTLKGRAPNLLSKERAAGLAKSIKGVRAVVNQISVRPDKEYSDKSIEEDIVKVLKQNPATENLKINTKVEGGSVLMKGTVESLIDKFLSENLIKTIKGVASIDNQLAVRLPVLRDDGEVERDIEEALEWNIYVNHHLIMVNVDEAIVKLSGVTGSLEEKETAVSIASWVSGVRAVEADNLVVQNWLKNDYRKTKPFIPRSDVQIVNAIKDALHLDPRVFSFNIDVNSDDGIVSLKGNVSSIKARDIVETTALSISGVKLVKNRIKVRPEIFLPKIISDDTLEARIEENLSNHILLDNYQLDAYVRSGVASLSGNVRYSYEKDLATELSSVIIGVKAVENNIKVNAYSSQYHQAQPLSFTEMTTERYDKKVSKALRNLVHADFMLKERIETELFWDPNINSQNIAVSVYNRRVVLEGEVGSEQELSLALKKAWQANPYFVESKLVIDK